MEVRETRTTVAVSKIGQSYGFFIKPNLVITGPYVNLTEVLYVPNFIKCVIDARKRKTNFDCDLVESTVVNTRSD
jgi:hypothetical protein